MLLLYTSILVATQRIEKHPRKKIAPKVATFVVMLEGVADAGKTRPKPRKQAGSQAKVGIYL